MQPLDALTLHHLAAELDVKLADGKVNKIQLPSHYEVLLHLWVGGDAGRQKLYINIRPEHAFCCLAEDTHFLKIPAQAPNFCMLLRKHLTSARILRVETLPGERVLNLHMDNYNELGQHVNLVLSVELMGKNSNIILYDAALKMILGCAHGVSGEMSRMREVSVGYPYVPPPQQDRPMLQGAPEPVFVQAVTEARAEGKPPEDLLTTRFMGVSKAVLQDLFSVYPAPEAAWQAFQDLVAGKALAPNLSQDGSRFSLLAAHQGEPGWRSMGSVNRLLETCFLQHLLAERVRQGRHQLQQIVKAHQKKLDQRRREVEISDPELLTTLKHSGNLLTIAHSEGQTLKGSTVAVMDYETGEAVTLEVDSSLSLLENAQLYYRRYKKGLARQDKALEMAEQLGYTQRFIADLNSALALATTLADLEAVREDLIAQGWLANPVTPRKGGGRAVEGPMPLKLTTSEGFTLLVGRNGLQNDRLVGKLARPEDLWFHAHLMPGSHVVLKTEKQEVSNRTLEEAALCAAYFSSGRDGVNVPVVYTPCRYVRKIPNSYPGHVNYTHEQAINITPSPDAMALFLAQLSAGVSA